MTLFPMYELIEDICFDYSFMRQYFLYTYKCSVLHNSSKIALWVLSRLDCVLYKEPFSPGVDKHCRRIKMQGNKTNGNKEISFAARI